MSELLPTRQAQSIQDGLLDYLATTFALADDDARLALLEFLTDPENGLFKGPFVRLRLPFRAAAGFQRLSWHPDFVPYGHQAAAFARLSTADPGSGKTRPLPTLITTGTGSGKTEAFLYPILDHVLRARRDGVTGMKALILYPMNALANDQAQRLTDLLTTREELAGITAALYTGEQGPQRTKVTRDGLITDRAIIRDSAPDILLTNYKMLDQLLLRHEDRKLWQQSATSLQYLVLDEFHTYDGAQGTDVAMLLRRLGLALKSYWPPDAFTPAEWARPLGRITPIATSATLGDQGDSAAMVEFASTVFGDAFDASCVVGEDRLTFDEWVANAADTCTTLGLTPVTPPRPSLREINETLAAAQATDPRELTLRVLEALFDATVPPDRPGLALRTAATADPSVLLTLVQAHPLTRTLVDTTGAATRLTELADLLYPEPPVSGTPDEEPVTFVTHLIAALSHIRATGGRAALTVDLHLWVRELTRIHRVASSTAEYRWSDDGTLTLTSREDPFEGQNRPVFPAIYCRHCGRSGWGVELAAVGTNLAPDDTTIWLHHATKQGRFRALLYAPLEADHAAGNGTNHETDAAAAVEGLRWFSIKQRLLLSTPPADDDRDHQEGWVLPVLTQVGKDADAESQADTCPSCQQKDSIRFLGSAVATLLSVTLSTLFGAEHLDPAEKKALVFTDSVQDAAHRAGFVESRSHVLTLRSVLRAAVGDHPIGLDALVTQAINQAGDDPFRRFRLVPPDLAERNEFAPFWRKEKARDVPAGVLTRVKRRLLFDALLEFGLQSRFGRTLEQVGSVVVEVDAGKPAKLASIGRIVLAKAEVQETLGEPLAHVPDRQLIAWVRGVLEHMRERGAIEHEWFNQFLKEDGNRYRIWGGRPRGQGMPAFPKGRSAPAFPRIGPTARTTREPLLDPVTSPQSWYARWTAANLPVTAAHGAKLARLLLERLVRADVLHAVATDTGGTVFAIPASSVVVHPTALGALQRGEHLLVCSVCHNQQPGTRATVDQLVGAPCLLVRCPGQLERVSRADNYYRRLYASTDMRRIVAREHSSLLDDPKRLDYETGFKQGQTQPDAPNVLVATPTLELGIDIGDLSAVLLASLPRTVASYLQRVGRAGRLTGNALNLAFITGRGVNLQRLGDPLSLINGLVRPPATYLSATEILRRQYLAHLVDYFARDAGRPHPRRASLAMQLATEGTFLGELVLFAESDAAAHLNRFLGCFDSLSGSAEAGLRAWATPAGGPGTSPLAGQVFNASQLWNATVEGLTQRQQAIQAALPELDQLAALPAASDEDKRAARAARAALKVTQKELGDLRGEYWIAVLEEFGLLPNYTLLDDSVTLEVALTWIDPDTQEWRFESQNFKRSSANALREFAPGATFYARGLEIGIDAVDLGVGESAIRTMAFCPSCGYATDVPADITNAGKKLAGEAKVTACPRCGDVGIGGIEHRLDVVELSRVSAEMNRDESQISDRSDERRRELFAIFAAADIDPANITNQWYVDGYNFGASYLSRLDVRWVNAGRQHGMSRQIAGVRAPAPLFRLCDSCGKLDKQIRANSRGEHRAWCKHRKSGEEHNRDIALIRTLSTQGAVLRLPLSVTLGDKFAMPSLAAAVLLGLQEQIGGLPDHIQVAPIHAPAASEPGTTVEALLLHDVVPGGTGYLAELARPARVWDLLYRAWQKVATCACADEPRLACYRCLLPFASPWQVDVVSRAAAERHLRDILTAGVQHAVPGKEMSWTTTTIEPTPTSDESHLEQKFRKVFTDRLQNLGATLKETPGPSGNTVHISFPNASRQWILTPQEQIGDSKPDFVLRSSQQNLPAIAIFTDGWAYHASPVHNRIADDARKRRHLRDRGMIVLSITWPEVVQAQNKAVTPPSWFDSGVLSMLMQQTPNFGPDHVAALQRGPIDFLLSWIQRPDPDGYEALANHLPWLFARDGQQLSLDPNESLAEAAVHQLIDVKAASPLRRAITNAWWWQAGDIGCLTRAAGNPSGSALEFIVVVDDRPARLGDGHRPAWEEWLRLGNIAGLRSQPTRIVAVSELLAGAVPPIEEAVSGVVAPEVGAEINPQWQEAVGLVSGDPARRLLVDLAGRGDVPVPAVGFEAEGIPIEISWPPVRIAVELDVDDDTRRELVAAGWTMVAADARAIATALSRIREER